MASFAEATAVRALDSQTYSVHFHDAWAIGSVPHGGIVTSNVLAAVKLHFETTLRSYNQPHTITLHLEFLRRTSTGPATVTIQNLKLGRRTSTVHVVLTQAASQAGNGSAMPTTCVVGYLTQSNLFTETGVSLATNWALYPPPLPLSSLAALRCNEDPYWEMQKGRPHIGFRKVGKHVSTYLPRNGQVAKATIDEWICFTRPDERFTQESLGFVSDMFPPIVEKAYSAAEIKAGLGDASSVPGTFWSPTVLLNLDVKKSLPPEGVDALFVRVSPKQIKNGRMDLEVVILDQEGDLVALSNHVALLLDSERNVKRNGSKHTSKL